MKRTFFSKGWEIENKKYIYIFPFSKEEVEKLE